MDLQQIQSAIAGMQQLLAGMQSGTQTQQHQASASGMLSNIQIFYVSLLSNRNCLANTVPSSTALSQAPGTPGSSSDGLVSHSQAASHPHRQNGGGPAFAQPGAGSQEPSAHQSSQHAIEHVGEHASSALPVLHHYQSSRGSTGFPANLNATGFPANQMMSSPTPLHYGRSFTPYVGASSLAPPLSTRNVNQARMASASASLPPRGNLAIRGSRRGRGRPPRSQANQAPSLQGVRPSAAACVVPGTNPALYRIIVKVYPACVSNFL